MAELERSCIENFCSIVPELKAGEHIIITGDEMKIIAADLTNYYSKAEVDALVNAIEVGEFVIVQSLPSTGNPRNIYLVPKTGGGYTEHVYIEGEGWELIGSTDIDLSNYYDKTAIDNLLANKQDKLTAGSNVQIANNVISATDTKYSAGTGLALNGTTFSAKTGYTTSGNNRKVETDSNGNLYVVQKDDNTTYSAGTGLALSGTTFSVKTGYTTSGNNRKVQTDSNGNLYVVQKDDNTTYSAGTNLSLSGTTFSVKDSPAFTGTPTAPTNGTASTSNTQIATTAFVQNAIDRKLVMKNVGKTMSGTVNHNAETDVTYANSYKFAEAGFFVGFVRVVMAANTSGARRAGALKYSSSGAVQSFLGAQASAPPSSGGWNGSCPVAFAVAANEAIGARMFQTSGSGLAYTVEVSGKLFPFVKQV